MSSPLIKFKTILRERIEERKNISYRKPTCFTSIPSFKEEDSIDTFLSANSDQVQFHPIIPYGLCSAFVSREADLNTRRASSSSSHNVFLCTRRINLSETLLWLSEQPGMPEELDSYDLLLDDNGLIITDGTYIPLDNYLKHLDNVNEAHETFENGNHDPKFNVMTSSRLTNGGSLVIFKNLERLQKSLKQENNRQVRSSGTLSIIELPNKIGNTTRPSSPRSRYISKDILLIFKDKEYDMKSLMRDMIKNTGICTSNVNRERGLRLDLINEAMFKSLFNKDRWLINVRTALQDDQESMINKSRYLQIACQNGISPGIFS